MNAPWSGAQVPAGCAPRYTHGTVCTLDFARACACVIEFARGPTQSCISRCICRYHISFRLLQVRHRQDTPGPVLYCTCTLSYADSSIDQLICTCAARDRCRRRRRCPERPVHVPRSADAVSYRPPVSYVVTSIFATDNMCPRAAAAPGAPNQSKLTSAIFKGPAPTRRH